MKKVFSEVGKTITTDKNFSGGTDNKPEDSKKEESKKEKSKKKSIYSIIGWNLIPSIIALGVYFLVYFLLPGAGYLHIFLAFLMSSLVLLILQGVITGLPIEDDINLYYIMLLVIFLTGTMLVNYGYKKELLNSKANQEVILEPDSTRILYNPGVYKFYLSPGESGPKPDIIVSRYCYYNVTAESQDFIIMADGKLYRPSGNLTIIKHGDTQLRFINGGKPIRITLRVERYN